MWCMAVSFRPGRNHCSLDEYPLSFSSPHEKARPDFDKRQADWKPKLLLRRLDALGFCGSEVARLASPLPLPSALILRCTGKKFDNTLTSHLQYKPNVVYRQASKFNRCAQIPLKSLCISLIEFKMLPITAHTKSADAPLPFEW
jgi:hypothetical protein